ncbi:prepilin-type N-terminal cleavage/methylation domain-containing protein [Vibrio astriarenae]|uniref:prepilin-type N-terminal cleavage/methylation domain-containing protein n=1 Tax=Vibrio astriarenae TaxID=1481923 RepID=UPI001EF8FFB8|nr:prepilin-type N-terminal cleavage/methylation domain-containing protein [Vibrio astriarenae]
MLIKYRGFTLIESVIAIVILAIAMLTITTMLVPNVQRSAEPQYQVQAAALAETLFNQILSRSFDENSAHDGGLERCGETGMLNCTVIGNFGPDGSEVTPDTDPATGLLYYAYNDVDDYGAADGNPMVYRPNCTGGNCRELNYLVSDPDGTYQNFSVAITVTYEQADVLKKIQLEINASDHGPYIFSAFRGNY